MKSTEFITESAESITIKDVTVTHKKAQYTIREKIIQFVSYVTQFQNPVISKNMRQYDFQKCSKNQPQAIQHGQSLIKILRQKK